jgi:hypothetical protein
VTHTPPTTTNLAHAQACAHAGNTSSRQAVGDLPSPPPRSTGPPQRHSPPKGGSPPRTLKPILKKKLGGSLAPTTEDFRGRAASPDTHSGGATAGATRMHVNIAGAHSVHSIESPRPPASKPPLAPKPPDRSAQNNPSRPLSVTDPLSGYVQFYAPPQPARTFEPHASHDPHYSGAQAQYEHRHAPQAAYEHRQGDVEDQQQASNSIQTYASVSTLSGSVSMSVVI